MSFLALHMPSAPPPPPPPLNPPIMALIRIVVLHFIFLCFALTASFPAFAQCNGIFSPYTVCGNGTGTSTPPKMTNPGTVVSGATSVFTTTNYTVQATEGTIICNKSIASATALTLPTVASRNSLSLHYIDQTGLCGDTTITPNGAETIGGLSSWIVSSGGVAGSGGSITLVPNSSLSGWAVAGD